MWVRPLLTLELIAFLDTYDIRYYENEPNVIAYIEHPVIAMIYSVPASVCLLYMYLGIMLSFCHCITDCFPQGC